MSAPPLPRALAAAIGTFALVFAGAGAVMVDAKTHALGHVGVAITFGLVIMAMIYAVGRVSGAHFNGAVTFAFALSRHFPWRLGHGRRDRLVCLRAECGPLADGRGALPPGGEGAHEAGSAGSSPTARVHPEVVEVMRELDVDLGGRIPQKPDLAEAEWADVVVTMGCGDACPYIPGKPSVDWELDDPAGKSLNETRAIRDEIAARIEQLLIGLEEKEPARGAS